MDLGDLYHGAAARHLRLRSGEGLLTRYTAEGRAVNPNCGDEVTVRVRIEGEALAEVGYSVNGCAICRAAASIMHVSVNGVPVVEARRLRQAFERGLAGDLPAQPERSGDDFEVFGALQAYPHRRGCALTCWRALEAALNVPLPDHPSGLQGQGAAQ